MRDKITKTILQFKQMRLTKIFLTLAWSLLICCMVSHANANNPAGLLQDSTALPRITLKMTNAPLDNIMKEISRQTGIDYGYQMNTVDKNRRFTIEVKNQTLKATLDKLFMLSDYTYVEQEGRIVIVKREKTALADTTAKQPPLVLQGKVIDKDGLPIPGASVTVVGTNAGVATNSEGRFTMTLHPGQSIEVRFVGYKTQQKLIRKSDSDLLITLEEEAQKLEQVVVTGIFEKSEASYTGAHTTISEKELKMFYYLVFLV